MVRKSGYIDQELVSGSICLKLPAECAEMQWPYVVHRLDTMCGGGGAETKWSQSC